MSEKKKIANPFALGILVQEARKSRGLSQTELANKAGISRRQLSNIENNIGSPGMYIVFALLNELNIALFSGEKPKTLNLDELVAKRDEEFLNDH